MVQKLSVRNQKAAPLKVSNKLGVRTLKQSGSGKAPVRRVGVLPPKRTVVKNYSGVRGEPIQFGLPSFGGSGGGAYPTNPNNLVFADSPTVNQAIHNAHEDNPGLNPLEGVSDLLKNLNDPQTYVLIVGYIVAVFLIAISLYGIVTGAKQQAINSVIGQNTSGLVNTFKPGKKKK